MDSKVPRRDFLKTAQVAAGMLAYAQGPAAANAASKTKAKAAEAAKKEAEQLAKAMDRVADGYVKAQKAKGVTVNPTPIAAPAAPTAAAPAKK